MTPDELAKLTTAELRDYKEAIQKRRDQRAAKEESARELQEVIDLEAIDRLEEEHGHGRVAAAPLRGWIPGRGAVTRIAIVVPQRSDHSYQRFQRLILQNRRSPARAVGAIEQLARLCLRYPDPEKDKDKEAYDATLELAPVMLNTIATMAQDLADADGEADAKKSLTS
jgi:hypothetical protein